MQAGVSKKAIVLTWASPLCETFSRPNLSNLSRGNNHRKKEEGWSPVEGEKGEKARAHDRLVQRIKEVFDAHKEIHTGNPCGRVGNDVVHDGLER